MEKDLRQNFAYSAVFYIVAAISIALYVIGLVIDNSVYAFLSVTLFAFSVVAGAVTLTHRTPRPFAAKAMRINATVLLTVYVLIIIQLTFFSRSTGIYTDVQNGFDNVREYYLAHFVNLEPFDTISNLYVKNLEGSDANRAYAIYNMLGNILLLAPTALLLPAIFRMMHNPLIYTATTLLLSCLVEWLQYATMRGSCDVDDVILNTSGAVLVMGITKIPLFSKALKKLLRQD